MDGYKNKIQEKNLAWFLPRPKPDHYKGGMPLYCEEWLIELAKNLYWGSGGKGFYDDEIKILNLFCGMNKRGVRVDINPEVKPDYCLDAHTFTRHDILGKMKFEFILADPPYSDGEAKELYGTPKLNYKKWTSECDKVLVYNGLLCVYHKYIMPNPNPEKYEVVKRVFIGNRTYHLPRVAIYFRKRKSRS